MRNFDNNQIRDVYELWLYCKSVTENESGSGKQAIKIDVQRTMISWWLN